MLITIKDRSWFDMLLRAQELFSREEFQKAREIRDTYIHESRSALSTLCASDSQSAFELSVIIVAYNTGSALLDCVDSILSQLNPEIAEVIIVDNGGNEALQDVLLEKNVHYIQLPVNIGPCEARNIGAMHASGELLVFIDDDGILEVGSLSSVIQAFKQFDFLAIRGRVLPLQNTAGNCLPGHYDLGEYPIPSLLETEGVMAVHKEVWDAVGGMDPMLFGAEGVEFTAKICDAYPGRDIYYWPTMVLRHDYTEGPGLHQKKRRHYVVANYFSEYNTRVKDLAQQYGLWYQARPSKYVRYDQRSFFQKVRAVVQETILKKRVSVEIPVSSGEHDFDCLKYATPPEAMGVDLLARRDYDSQYRISLLEDNLSVLRSSYAYRFGRLVADTCTRPLLNGLVFPGKLFFLIREILNTQQETGASNKVPVRTNLATYTSPGREEHRCSVFSDAPMFVCTERSGAKIGCLLPEEMVTSLSYSVQCCAPNCDAVEEWLEKTEPEIFIGSPLFDGRDNLQKRVFECCKRKGIPTAFWYTEDSSAFEPFEATARLADHCFVSSRQCAEEVATKIKADVLLPAIAPAQHNPVTMQGADVYDVQQTICFDGWCDFVEFPEYWQSILASLEDVSVNILESQYSFMANKLDDLPPWRSSILGCLSSEQLATALKSYPLLIQGEQTLRSRFSRAKGALQAIACGANVVSLEQNNILEEFNIPEGSYCSLRETSALPGVVSRILGDSSRMGAIQVARRFLYDNHTFTHRLRTIYNVLGCSFSSHEEPLCTLITPTKRPHMLEKCLQRHRSQSYVKIESLVVLNTVECDVQAVRTLCDRYSAKLLIMPADFTIGQCLNEGIRQARGQMWFKIDDDDYYGENYVKDTVHSWQMTGADLFGKAAGYIYFEEDQSLYLRELTREASHKICTKALPHMSGATFAGYLGRNTIPPFPEKQRACVDSLFFKQAIKRETRIHMTDLYNFAAYRGADKKHHTWKQGDSVLKRSAQYVGPSEALTSILI